ncbi:MAG: hypothetical protein A2Z14_12615 [Chloroflexi bacterium RBG_16_48_8]|nr:MAG: hypothetical protein A2Z14_12615 [Chloroflexi bacterium RBG_16_48_8]
MLEWERIRILPSEYRYPLHLHQEVPSDFRPLSLNSQVCPVYEGFYQHPDTLNGLEDHEPLRTWLLANMPVGNHIEKASAHLLGQVIGIRKGLR